MTSSDDGVPSKLRVWVALCVLWMLIFAVVHALWAFGSTFALPQGFSVTENTALFVISIAAVPLSLVGALLAGALLHPIARTRRKVAIVLVAAVGVICVVHAADTIVWDIGALLGIADPPATAPERFSAYVYEPWWLLGGVLFLGAAAVFSAVTAPAERSGRA